VIPPPADQPPAADHAAVAVWPVGDHRTRWHPAVDLDRDALRADQQVPASARRHRGVAAAPEAVPPGRAAV